jgi:3-hydroxyisobutyrate dehydrogenase
MRTVGRIGFVGLGAMGEPMATQLAAAAPVLVYDVDQEKARRLAETVENVTAAESAAELAPAHMVICMLPSSAIVEAVILGPAGLAEVLAPGALIVDMSSSDPRRTVELAHAVSERGLELVDAPVSGGVRQARIGELTVMFGGSAAQLERCMPAFEAVGSRVVHVGWVGAAHALKALNNVMSAVGLSVACEVVEVGRRFGLDPNIMLEVINSSTGRNHATETKIAQYVLSGSYDSGFLLRLMLKDLGIAAELAHDVGAETPIGQACLDLWTRAAEALPADADQTRIAEVLQGDIVREGGDA